MIEKIMSKPGIYSLMCDICCDEFKQETFSTFSEAVEFKKNNGWKSKKIDGEWQDICPDCQKERNL